MISRELSEPKGAWQPAEGYRSRLENCAWFPFENLRALRNELSGYFKVNDSGFALGGNRQATPIAKGFWRNFEAGRGLLALVLGTIDHTNHASHRFNVEPAILRNALCRMRIFHVIFQHCVQYFVGRERSE